MSSQTSAAGAPATQVDSTGGFGGGSSRWRNLRRRMVPYAFIAPSASIFALFMFLPVVLTFVLSLQRSSGLGPAEFIGLENYGELLGDQVFRRAFLNTLVFTLATVPTSLALGLWSAVGLNKKLRGTALFRSVFYLPVVISGVAVGIIMVWNFNETVGVANQILERVGLPAVSWQSSGPMAMLSLVIAEVWTRLGFAMVVYLAALQGVPAQLYEAARIDGATKRQRFWQITWPLLRPTTAFLVVIGVINAFRVFDLVFVMTGGGPGFATEMLVTYIYDTGFAERQQGLAAAMGVVLFLVVMAFTVVYWRVSEEEGPE